MKKLLIALTCLSFTACAANPAVYQATKQNYRPIGESKKVEIEARLVHKKNLLDDDYAVLFKIDGEMFLYFQLTKNGNGSLSCTKEIKSPDGLYDCNPHNGKPIGANCTGSTANGRLISTQCAFTYDNEIAANFSF